MTRSALIVAVFGLGTAWGWAQLPCVSYEGDEMPENQGWERNIYGGGAQRYLDLVPGALVIDGWASTDISDFYDYPLAALPEPGQVLRVDWRLRVDMLRGWSDPAIAVESPTGAVVLTFTTNRVYSVLETEWLLAYFTPGEFHEFTFVSTDVQTYELALDGVPIWFGEFVGGGYPAQIRWGDATQGAASVATWDYVRFEVTMPGDVDGDGDVDFGDINPFVAVLSAAGAVTPCALHASDINQDGAVDFGDINPFVEMLTR